MAEPALTARKTPLLSTLTLPLMFLMVPLRAFSAATAFWFKSSSEMSAVMHKAKYFSYYYLSLLLPNFLLITILWFNIMQRYVDCVKR